MAGRGARVEGGGWLRSEPSLAVARVSLYAVLPFLLVALGERALGLGPRGEGAFDGLADYTWRLGALTLLTLAPLRLFRWLGAGEAFFEVKLWRPCHDALAIIAVVFALRFVGALIPYQGTPSEGLVVLTGVLALLAALYLSARLSREDASRLQMQRPPRDVSEDDLALAALHEAGHVLVWSLRHVPLGVSVGALNGTLGRVQGDPGDARGVFHNAPYLRWRMMTALAGSVAQELVRGERTTGSESDHARWERDARLYLEGGFGGTYYSHPRDDAEARHNVATLATLKREQTRVTQAFLSLNQAVLEALAQTLLARRELAQQDLAPFVADLRSESVCGFMATGVRFD